MADLGFIHRYIPAGVADARVLLLLHGTGGDEGDLLPLGRAIDPDAALLSPRGKVLENGSPRFFRRFAEGVFDEEDVAHRGHELADFIEAAAANYGFELRRVLAVGYSNGANIASAVLLLRPNALRAAVLLRAMVPLSSAPATSLTGHSVLISNGASDPIVAQDEGERLAEAFRAAGAEVRFALQRAGHNLVPADVTSAGQFARSLM